MKNKTLATWLTLLLGAFGLHRFYLHGTRDAIAWVMPLPTALGVYGFERVAEYGLDDVLSWWLLPLLGFHLAAVCLTAIVYGLMPQERWNLRFNPEADAEAPAGATRWLTIFAVIVSLMLGTVFLLSSLAYAFQRFFEVTA